MGYGNCGDCEFWKESRFREDGNMYGQCRIHPPAFGNASLDALWPHTEHYQGCGKNVPLASEPKPIVSGVPADVIHDPGCCCIDCIPF